MRTPNTASLLDRAAEGNHLAIDTLFQRGILSLRDVARLHDFRTAREARLYVKTFASPESWDGMFELIRTDLFPE